ncbi:MAG: hypothetical protein QOI20_477 [Acidimicrobiaceae bacterium]|nr:hypothetical protein [Acidimicrobiaceae bacterium]
MLLDADPDLDVVGTAVTGSELVKLCDDVGADVALLELDGEPDQVHAATTGGGKEAESNDACRVAGALREDHPDLQFVCVFTNEVDAARAREAGFPTVLPRAEGIRPIVQAIRASASAEAAPIVVPETHAPRDVLSPREIDILALVAGGGTTHDISARLGISRKTVENHKQRIFAKLGVQNQAHAVAVAMRLGLISADGVLDLADAAMADVAVADAPLAADG